ncbi:hypothetical protein SAMN04487911_11086 [Arenibacter nanhaiticus]|uniref:Outer membrane protein beta-barrel domain-containing protein n=1 Tax=Arenibacter nanhaiticus TaxID=558155 RepID=A0A1M6GAA0_9FLAO|nr:hypothetical protein [Arenibacter nanhaiticus]SHJ06848.1 hypothetical protein SAMN04487911_11086 [Arenibacter nanhaiticus]
MKTNQKIKMCLILLALMSVQLFIAQEQQIEAFQEVPIKDLQVSDWSLGFVAGGKSIKNYTIYESGIQVAKSILDGHRLRVDLIYRSSNSGMEGQWGNRSLNLASDIRTLMAAFSYEWFPFSANQNNPNFFRSLKIRGGLWYVNDPKFFYDATLKDEVRWGELVFEQEEIGTVKTNIITNKVQPFLSLGYDPFYIGKKFNLIIEAGANYHGQPSVDMVATNMLTPTSSQAPILENNIKEYQFMPFVQLVMQINL